MLVSKAQYYLGGDSVCRNKALQKMFMLIGFSEKAGSGVNKIIKGWREANWQKPYVEEFSRPDKVELTLPMISLLPDDAVIKLKELFDGKVENLTQDELTALVTCYSEGGINNTQLQYVSFVIKDSLFQKETEREQNIMSTIRRGRLEARRKRLEAQKDSNSKNFNP